MVERFAARLRCLYENGKILLRLRLADELGKPFGAQ